MAASLVQLTIGTSSSSILISYVLSPYVLPIVATRLHAGTCRTGAAVACADGVRAISGRSTIKGRTRSSLHLASNLDAFHVQEQVETEIARGYTMTQFCNKMIEVFLYERPRPRDWRKLLMFRDEWKKYRVSFYQRLQVRVSTEKDASVKQKLMMLDRRIKKIEDEIERHTDLINEIQLNPMDINAIVVKRRKEFTDEFFRHINMLSETYDSLEERDALVRLGTKCLSSVCAYDNAVQSVDVLESAYEKYDDILSSSSLEEACEKVQNLAKAKELDSSLILLINGSWVAAKESPTMSDEVKDIMYRIYKTTKNSLKSIAPPEIKLLKYLLNIIDPEERFSALATAFSPGDQREAKDVNIIYTTPKELHRWIKIMLDAYQLNKQETDMRDARNMTHPVVIQRLFILRETIEEEYLKPQMDTEETEND